jgi:2-polyprenyl-6-methoxyphenol hydroxylase-like FAD-dependent oxidoreductase
MSVVTDGDGQIAHSRSHGYPIGWIQRQNLLQILFNHIPEKTKVLVGKRFVKAESSADGIIAHCSDGSSYKGDIIIGADGAHSSVRQSMWQHMKDDGLEDIIRKDATGTIQQDNLIFSFSNKYK